MKECPRCGGQNPDGVGVCRACGARFGGADGLFARLFRALGRALAPGGSRSTITETYVTKGPTVRIESAGGLESLPPAVREGVEQVRRQRPRADVRVGPEAPVQQITVTENGITRTYGSWQEMPPHLQEKYRDILREHGGADAPRHRITVELDGVRRTYDSLDEVPPDLRRTIEHILATRDRTRGGRSA